MSGGNASNVVHFYDGAARSESNTLAHRRQTRILHLRNFNNWTKSMLISQYIRLAREKFGDNVRLRVLDFCCGKGGDQMKWAQRNVDHVTFVDISSASMEACKMRYDQLSRKSRRLYTADFHVHDCTTDLTKSEMADKHYHIVSSQFALHYAFESSGQANTFMNNVSHFLQPGGFFIASVPNAYEIVKRAEAAYRKQPVSSDEAITFGNTLYSIKFSTHGFTSDATSTTDEKPNKPPFPLYGAQYDFRLEGVVDCPEYLVYPPLVDKLASLHALTPLSTPLRFANFFKQVQSTHEGADNPLELLRRMDALEAYANPGRDDNPESDDGKEREKSYTHVDKKLVDNEACRNSKYLGTLSEDEWDVINLYSIFAYQKNE